MANAFCLTARLDAIETILEFHSLTVSTGMPFAMLSTKVLRQYGLSLTKDHVTKIVTLMPEALNVDLATWSIALPTATQPRKAKMERFKQLEEQYLQSASAKSGPATASVDAACSVSAPRANAAHDSTSQFMNMQTGLLTPENSPQKPKVEIPFEYLSPVEAPSLLTPKRISKKPTTGNAARRRLPLVDIGNAEDKLKQSRLITALSKPRANPKSGALQIKTANQLVPGSVLQRILAKEADRKVNSVEDKLRQKHVQFIADQAPAVARVLAALLPFGARQHCLTKAELITKLQDSMTTPLSCSDLMETVQLLATKSEPICRVVRLSGETFVWIYRSPPAQQQSSKPSVLTPAVI